MAEDKQPTDRVLSYCVGANGVRSGQHAELDQALDEGYRVTALHTSVVGGEIGIVVTVVLTRGGKKSRLKDHRVGNG
jgi:hypothetical protein